MDQVVTMLLSALVILVIAFGTEGKFSFFYQGKDTKKLAQTTKGLSRFVIHRNRELKYFGLALMWAGYSFGPSLLDQGPSWRTVAPYVTVGLGFFIYLLSRLWPILGK